MRCGLLGGVDRLSLILEGSLGPLCVSGLSVSTAQSCYFDISLCGFAGLWKFSFV